MWLKQGSTIQNKLQTITAGATADHLPPSLFQIRIITSIFAHTEQKHTCFISRDSHLNPRTERPSTIHPCNLPCPCSAPSPSPLMLRLPPPLQSLRRYAQPWAQSDNPIIAHYSTTRAWAVESTERTHAERIRWAYGGCTDHGREAGFPPRD